MVKEENAIVGSIEFSQEKIQLLKDTICKNASDSELQLFMHVSQRLGLDPFMKQIHMVPRPFWDGTQTRTVMSIQTGIDGYRLIAERSGKYMPGREPTFTYDDRKMLFSATSYVKKLGPDNQWHEIASTAFYDEYVGLKKDGTPTAMWKDKPHIMLAKCAESAALRRAFPAEMSGVYTDEEMERANVPTIGYEKGKEIEDKIGDDTGYLDRILSHYTQKYKRPINSISEIEIDQLDIIEKKLKIYNETRLQKEMSKTIEVVS